MENESKNSAGTCGKMMSLRSLLGGDATLESYQESCKQTEQELGPHWREVIELSKKNAELESRIAELRDLLGLETHKALSESSAQEIRDRIAAREKKENPPKDGDA